ncbi:hypothetical protein ALC57_02374 [Trachymyrmex cornetzi]|uniref:Uncharacterized protein n=1 Tax=Trachymyrmex cornetzi TaxID=471704 RepID=A0A195EJ84_9HYME|nr:hypothetical protein ALC57_02374 [Trachymyrmex cornetzi]
MGLSSVDPYSYAIPDIAKVVHTHLDLFVDFNGTVLRGEAILFIEMIKLGYHQIVNIFENSISVTDCKSGQNLEYFINKNSANDGSQFIIHLPLYYRRNFTEYKYKYRKIPRVQRM